MVLPLELYQAAGGVHTNEDTIIDFKYAEKTQSILNGHVSMFLKMKRMGENHEHEDRQSRTHIEEIAAFLLSTSS